MTHQAEGSQRTPDVLALPLELDWLKNEGGCGGYESPCIRDANGKIILDALNPDVACLQEEYDGDEHNTWHRVWDEDSRQRVAYIVEACNSYKSLRAMFDMYVENAGKVTDALTTERDALREQLAKFAGAMTFEEQVRHTELTMAEYARKDAEISELREQLAAMKAYEQDALRLNALRELMGYVECGEGCAVKMYQDDATRTFFVDVGKRSYYGNSFRAAIDAAIAAAKP